MKKDITSDIVEDIQMLVNHALEVYDYQNPIPLDQVAQRVQTYLNTHITEELL